jgi:hypothetical protein
VPTQGFGEVVARTVAASSMARRIALTAELVTLKVAGRR